ncbi:MAG: carboxypeptidase M32 [Erysipelotrichales bacterium]|nr:MAG: carboxypeptidase M32 [Erysipelotrichales bacterium]
MKDISLIRRFAAFVQKDAAFSLALRTMYFDMSTIAPKKGAEYRSTSLSILSGEAFTHATSKKTIALLEAVSVQEENDFAQEQAKAVLKDLERIRFIPKKQYVAFTKLCSDAENIWEQAREKKDFDMFSPYLHRLIEGTKANVKTRHRIETDYDVLLGDYEPRMTQVEYDRFFNVVKVQLVPFLHRLLTEGTKPDTSFLYKDYPVEKQKQFMETLKEALFLDPKSSYLATSAHPFSSSFSKYDNRITVRYLKDNVTSAIFSLIHEVGHATYNHQIDQKHEGTVFFDNMSMGMHESQSRMMENMLGRNRAFWVNLYPKLVELFPENLSNVDLDAWVGAINAVDPGFIRTEADELTYPLHVLLRYEIERDIFNGTINVKNIEAAWNAKIEDFLGLTVGNSAEGVLQDIHWSSAMFGYFPTYALGSAYSAQWMMAMRKDLDVEALLASNHMDTIKQWLEAKIHRYGGSRKADELLREVSGEPFNPQYYVDYLIAKYSKLYQLD